MDDKNLNKKKPINGGRNLVILGVFSVVLALMTTIVSLVIYHNSGDIYLDRSRPGFLPDEEEIEEESEKEEAYDFEKSGPINKEVLEEYLENIQMEVDAIDAYEKPFNEERLSDKRFGIPEAEEE